MMIVVIRVWYWFYDNSGSNEYMKDNIEYKHCKKSSKIIFPVDAYKQ